MSKVTIDRREGDFLIVIAENAQKFQIAGNKFPTLKEGDVIDLSDSDITSATKEIQDRVDAARKGLNQVEL